MHIFVTGHPALSLRQSHELTATIANKQALSEINGNIIKTIKDMNGMVEIFDEGLWGGMVEYATAFNKKKVLFTFKGGIEIIVEV
ncbi:MAG: hypothetical protein ACYDEX_02495 [Mobilitalea sp.]